MKFMIKAACCLALSAPAFAANNPFQKYQGAYAVTQAACPYNVLKVGLSCEGDACTLAFYDQKNKLESYTMYERNESDDGGYANWNFKPVANGIHYKFVGGSGRVSYDGDIVLVQTGLKTYSLDYQFEKYGWLPKKVSCKLNLIRFYIK